MSLSDDGGRYMHDNSFVRDRDFALIGQVPALPRLTGEPNYFVVRPCRGT